MSLRSFFKGWVGEAQGAFAQWAFLDKNIYTSLNNVTLSTPNGTTQIDHVIISRFGVFIVESKNIDGWIFGDAKSAQWSVVRPGRRYRFQNPLHQNHRHVKAVAAFLGIDEARIHPMVMFWGDCEFKTAMPPNVIDKGYSGYIKRFVEPVFSDAEVAAIIQSLRSGALPKTWATRQQHLSSLRDRHSSTTICAKCGGTLVLRTTRTGANAGSKFYGCSGYPKCRHTVPVAAES